MPAKKKEEKSKACDCKCHMFMPKMPGLAVLLLGLGLLLNTLGNPIGKWWPFVLVAGGLAMLLKPMCSCCDHAKACKCC